MWWRGQDLNLRPAGYEPDDHSASGGRTPVSAIIATPLSPDDLEGYPAVNVNRDDETDGTVEGTP